MLARALAAQLGWNNIQDLLVPLASWQQSQDSARERLVTVQDVQRQADFKKKLYCPQCNEALTLKRESRDGKRRAHFSHLPGAGSSGHGEGQLHLLAKAFIEAKLAEITFKWSDCALGATRGRKRCFAGNTVVLEQMLGVSGRELALSPEETRLRPDVTILDQNQTVVAFVEVFVSSRKEPRHWHAYAKFPHAVAVEIEFKTEIPKGEAGFLLQDTKRHVSEGWCASCTAQKAEERRAKLAEEEAAHASRARAEQEREREVARRAQAERQREQELATRVVEARSLVQAQLSRITFRWSACAAKLAPECRRKRCFEQCTAEYCTLGATGLSGLTPEEAEYKPDLTILDRKRRVVSLIEFCTGNTQQPRCWQTYSRFPGVLFLQVYAGNVHYLAQMNYTLHDEKSSAKGGPPCRFCGAAERERQRAELARGRGKSQGRAGERRTLSADGRPGRTNYGREATSEPRQRETAQPRALCDYLERRLKRSLSPSRVQTPLLAGGLPAWLSDEEAAVFPSLT